MEQILVWNPEVILFSPDSIFASVAQDAIWGELDAIKSGRYYETPMGPYNWLGFPPSVQRCLGMMWMANLLYPEAAQYDLHEEVSEYFRLFYHCDLSEAQYRALIENSIGRRK
jgi:iron complex transport system substrate-binding protein